MKNKSLFFQIWLVCAGISVGISLMLMVVIPIILSQFFTKEIFQTIEHAQNTIIHDRGEGFSTPPKFPFPEDGQLQQNIRTVEHMLIAENGHQIAPAGVSPQFVKEVNRQILTQTAPIDRYSRRFDDETMFYIIRKEQFGNRAVFIVSYMWDTYYNALVKTLYHRLALFMGAIALLSWLPSLWLAKYLSRPLVQLEDHVGRIANREWHTPVNVDRRDEIGRLAHSIERMRQQLLRQDEAQQSLLQHISHELKTPVMVIRSYVSSIQDGVFPKGDLASSVEVIDQESERLEKRIRALLYLTKLDYLSTHSPVREPVKFDQLLDHVVERLRWRKPDLAWSVETEPVSFSGDREQWMVAIENLMDNQIRYAASRVDVKLRIAVHDGRAYAVARIWNDGPPIEESQMNRLFHQFHKGYKGEFGLGLAIVQRIATLHGAQVWANNEHDGVAFYIEIPIERS